MTVRDDMKWLKIIGRVALILTLVGGLIFLLLILKANQRLKTTEEEYPDIPAV